MGSLQGTAYFLGQLAMDYPPDLARKRSYQLTVVHYGSAAAVTLGAFWFASRAWFGG